MKIETIPTDQIRVLNPRARNKVKFQEIVDSVDKLGLKKPITVSPREGGGYDLICGQGRLEAYQELGEAEVPAVVREVTEEDRLLMSLVENIARRNHSAVELLSEIGALRQRGYKHREIAKKTGIASGDVSKILTLLKHSEDRLIMAVERGRIPLTIATTIATAKDEDVQKALEEAYETGKLKGKALERARTIVETRRARGKKNRYGKPGKRKISAKDLVRTYTTVAGKQKRMVKKAQLCETRLTFVASALRELLDDPAFVDMLRAEKINDLPKYLAERING